MLSGYSFLGAKSLLGLSLHAFVMPQPSHRPLLLNKVIGQPFFTAQSSQ
jgi:hypothetical protein